MRVPAIYAALLLGAAGAACDSRAATEPDPLSLAVGEYTLVSYQGTKLPATTAQSANTVSSLESGGLILRADSTYDALMVERTGVFTRQECDMGGECTMRYSTRTSTEEGTYTVAGGDIVVVPRNPMTRFLYGPVLQGDSITAQRYVFRRVMPRG